MQQSPGIWVSILVLYCIYYTSNYSMLLCRYSPIVLTFCTIFFQLTSFPVGLLIILHLHLDRAYPSKCHAALRLRAGRLGIEVKASRVERWPQGTRVEINGFIFTNCPLPDVKKFGICKMFWCFGFGRRIFKWSSRASSQVLGDTRIFVWACWQLHFVLSFADLCRISVEFGNLPGWILKHRYISNNIFYSSSFKCVDLLPARLHAGITVL